ncbi:hypothetical protein ACHAW6_001873 [Cyclotella cf. meneghiniana]
MAGLPTKLSSSMQNNSSKHLPSVASMPTSRMALLKEQ